MRAGAHGRRGMRRAGPCPRERCAPPQARARSRRGGAVGAWETADGGTLGANGAQHSRAEHRPVCQAGYLYGGTAGDHRGGGTTLAHRHTTQSRASVSGAAASPTATKITLICTRRCPASRAAANEQNQGGSGAPAPRLPVTPARAGVRTSVAGGAPPVSSPAPALPGGAVADLAGYAQPGYPGGSPGGWTARVVP